jgi:hypothetical protein
MSPGDLPFGYPNTRASIPVWVRVQGLWFGLAMLAVMAACGFALEDRRRAFLCLGAVALTFGTWITAAVLKGLRTAGILGLVAAIFTVVAVLGFLSLGPGRRELPELGDALVRRLEAHRASRGSYPETLKSAGIHPDWTRFGGWWYESTDGGLGYVLGIGDYSRDNFVLYRVSGDSEWSWDT